MFLGFEMFLVLGVPAVVVKEAYYSGMPDVILIQKMVAGIDHSILLAIPFFLFAAELMSEGRIAVLLSRSTNACFRRFRGGPGYGAIGACMAFGSVCGSAPATVAALGRLMYPSLRAVGFSDTFSLGLIVSAAETALLIPPSITLIIYGWITETSIARLFAGGLIVGIVMGLAFAVAVLIEVWRRGIGLVPDKVSATGAVLRGTFWALGMPVIILGGIYAGIVTATEAAAVSVIYAVFVEAVIFRTLTMRKFLAIAQRSALMTSIIFMLLAAGSVISYFITIAQVPEAILAFMKAIDAGPYLFLLVVNIVLLIAGMFIDPGTAIVVLMPALFPVAVSLGIRSGASRSGRLRHRLHRHDHAAVRAGPVRRLVDLEQAGDRSDPRRRPVHCRQHRGAGDRHVRAERRDVLSESIVRQRLKRRRAAQGAAMCPLIDPGANG